MTYLMPLRLPPDSRRRLLDLRSEFADVHARYPTELTVTVEAAASLFDSLAVGVDAEAVAAISGDAKKLLAGGTVRVCGMDVRIGPRCTMA